MLQGKQIGTYLPDGLNGIQVRYEQSMSIRYQRIVDGKMDEYVGLAIEKEIYDERQGTYVAGIVLCDASGYPIKGEEYKMNDFVWSGNLSYGNANPIEWGFM